MFEGNTGLSGLAKEKRSRPLCREPLAHARFRQRIAFGPSSDLIKCLFVQFPPEAVRDIARLLRQSDLGEISFEARKGERLTLKRTPKILAAPAPLELVAPDAPEVEVVQASVSPGAPEPILVCAPCVGVFHVAKATVEVGSMLGKKQLLGIVESLKVPNEIYAPAGGVVAQIWVGDGQGVEWGQPLFEIQPGPAPSEPTPVLEQTP